MRRFLLFVTMLLASSLALPAFAQPVQGPGPDPRVEKRMRQIRANVLRKRMGLSEARAAKVERILDQFQADKRKARDGIRDARQKLRQLFRSQSDDQAAYQKALSQLQTSHQAIQRLRERQFAALNQELKPKEQALLLVELGRIGRRMNQLQHRRRGMGPPGMGPGRGRRGLGPPRGRGPAGWGPPLDEGVE